MDLAVLDENRKPQFLDITVQKLTIGIKHMINPKTKRKDVFIMNKGPIS